MHKPLLYIILLLLSLPLSMEAQKCVCIECPQNTINNDTLELTYNIQSTLDTLLSSPTQGICRVNVRFKHDVIGDMLIKLVSPSGQFVTLVGPHLVSMSQTILTTWDVSFIPIDEPAFPDIGIIDPKWDNGEAWASISFYSGSYYPNSGGLKNFNAGSVNGTWTLQVVDAQQTASVFTGEVLDFSITLCNPIGLNCFNCEAEGGTLNETDFAFCQADEQLNISTNPTYADAGPDVISYGYGYVLSNGGVMTQFLDSVDLRLIDAGLYDICGISYYRPDKDSIPNYIGLAMSDLRNALDTLAFCGELSTDCFSATIYAPPATTTFNEEICIGDSFIMNNVEYNEMGTFRDTIFGAAWTGCDSTFLLTLLVKPEGINSVVEKVCEGTVINLNGKDYNQTNIYRDTMIAGAWNGCDSIIILDLTIKPLGINQLSESICEGDVYEINNKSYTEAGTYRDTLPNASWNTCDSIIILDLSVKPNGIKELTETICRGDFYEWNNKFYGGTDVYQDTIIGGAWNGCDSILNLDLTVNDLSFNVIQEQICAAGSVEINAKLYTMLGSYRDTIFNGSYLFCDSILLINISLNEAADEVSISSFTCDPNNVGIVTENLVNENGCDSIVTITTTLGLSSKTFLEAGVCSADSVGQQDTIILNGFQCDSLVITNYFLLPSDTTRIEQITCNEQDTGTVVEVFTNMFGCDSIVIIETILEGSFSYSIVLKEIACHNGSDGEISIIPFGDFNVRWESGRTEKTIRELSAGTYNVSITGGGCSEERSIILENPDLIEAKLISQNGGCGGFGGKIDVAEIKGGTPPYNYLWNNEATTKTIEGLPAGEYSVIITDANDCSSSLSTQLEFDAGPAFTSEVTNITCAGANDGAINLEITDGAPPYTIDWSTGDTTSQLANLSAGNYTVYFSDENGCLKAANFFINEPDQLQVNFNIIGSGGANNGSVSALVMGGTTPYTYSWNTGGSSADIRELSTGDYAVTVTDRNGCTVAAIVHVAISTAVTPPTVLVKEYKIYPIPANEYIMLEIDFTTRQYGEIIIYNTIGQVKEIIPFDTQKMNKKLLINHYQAGTYILAIKTKEHFWSRKLVIIP